MRLPAQVAKERYVLLMARLEKRKAQLALEHQISTKVPILKGVTLEISMGLLLAQQGQADPTGVDAAARKRVERLAMGRMPWDVSAQCGKGRVDGADSVTLTINEVNIGRNSPHRFRLALVTVTGNQAADPVYVSGVDWGVPGFGDTQITKNM